MPSWTVASYAAHWLEDVVRTRLKPATFMSNRETLRLHILPTLGRVKMHALRPDQVRALLAQRLAAGLSPRSVQIVHGTLRSRLGEAVREEVITLNPSAIVRPPSSEHHADPSVTLRIYAHVIQELTPAVAATFAGAVEAAIRGQSGAVVSNSVSNTDRTPLRPVGQTNSE